MSASKKAIFYKKLKNSIVQCTACNHYCKISKGKTGICGVRKNIAGSLFLLVYGKAIAFHIDPIEKKPLYHFLPKTEILSFGTVGCNFRCDFCQNWDISQTTKEPFNCIQGKLKNLSPDASVGIPILKHRETEERMFGQKLLPKDIVNFAKDNNIPSIAYTYNEPAIFIEYALDTMRQAKKNKIKNVFVTNGYFSKESREKFLPYLDAANIDLKSFEDEFYIKICGAKIKPVLENIEALHKAKVHIEITTLIIPDKNDSEKNLKNIAKFIASIDEKIPWHISRFFPSYKMTDIAPTPITSLKTAYNIGKNAGLKNVYIGNV